MRWNGGQGDGAMLGRGLLAVVGCGLCDEMGWDGIEGGMGCIDRLEHGCYLRVGTIQVQTHLFQMMIVFDACAAS